MLAAVIRTGAAVLLGSALLAACSSTTSGEGAAEVPTRGSSSTPDFPIAPATSEPSTDATTPEVSTPATSTILPAPPTPLRTVPVHTEDTDYVVKIWWDVEDDTCFDHAYGEAIVSFLITHPCSGLHRYLGTTTVNGRAVGFALSSTGFPGRPRNLYGEAGRFAQLEQADGTGSLNDLLRELDESPRVGVLELSRRLGVARGTVQARLDRLVERGVIASFAPTVDPVALGFTVTAFATLEIRQGQGQAVLQHLLEIPEVLEVHTITGPGDMLCRVVARSNADLQRVLDRLTQHEEIVRTSTVIALSNPVRHRVLPLV
jgi:DNA-binding Lrp family transcriptional regulator